MKLPFAIGLVFTFCLICTSSIAQDNWEKLANKADSLRRSGSFEASIPHYKRVLQQIPKSQIDDQNKYHIRIGLSYFMLGKNEEAKYHYQLVVSKTENNQENIFRGHALNNLGLLFQNIGDLERAEHYYEKASKTYTSINEPFLSDIAQMNLGKVAHEMGDYHKAMEYLTQTAQRFEQRGDFAQLGEVYSTLGLIQESLGDLLKAKKLHRMSIAFREKVDDPYDLASSYNNIGWVFQESGQLDSAQFFYHRALELMNGKGDRNLGIVYHNLASVYQHQEDWTKAKWYLEQALEVKRTIGDSSEVFISLTAMASIMNAQANYVNSRKSLESGRTYAKRSSSKKDLRDYHTEWKIYFQGIGMPDSALVHFEEASRLERELFKEKYTRELAFFQESFEANHREGVIDELGAKNKGYKETIGKKNESISKLVWTIGGVSVICFILLLISVIVRQRSKKLQLDLEKKSLESRLKGIEEEKKRVSMELHDASGSNMRTVVNDLLELVKTSKGEIQDHLEKIYQKTESTMHEIVMISRDLHHPNLTNVDFITLIEDHIYDWLENKNYEYTENITSKEVVQVLSIDSKNHVFRYIQETFINIQRHSNATAIQFDVTTMNGDLIFTIKDNGNSTTSNQKSGIGQKNLEARAELMKGKYSFMKTNNGCVSILAIPIATNLA